MVIYTHGEFRQPTLFRERPSLLKHVFRHDACQNQPSSLDCGVFVRRCLCELDAGGHDARVCVQALGQVPGSSGQITPAGRHLPRANAAREPETARVLRSRVAHRLCTQRAVPRRTIERSHVPRVWWQHVDQRTRRLNVHTTGPVPGRVREHVPDAAQSQRNPHAGSRRRHVVRERGDGERGNSLSMAARH